MPRSRPTVARIDHHRALQGVCAAAVPRAAGARVLDVASGDGGLAERLAARGAHLVGLERDTGRAAALRARGAAAVLGDAARLPFADAAFDWAVLRHALHHVEDEDAALAELVRVAREGVVIAEPWRETGWPEQRTAAAYDAWLKGQHRRVGMHHCEDVPPERVVARLDALGRFAIETTRHARRVVRPPAEVDAEIEEAAYDLPAGDPARAVIEALRPALARDGVGATGTAIVVARRV